MSYSRHEVSAALTRVLQWCQRRDPSLADGKYPEIRVDMAEEHLGLLDPYYPGIQWSAGEHPSGYHYLFGTTCLDLVPQEDGELMAELTTGSDSTPHMTGEQLLALLAQPYNEG